jgi:hypothetical protein
MSARSIRFSSRHCLEKATIAAKFGCIDDARRWRRCRANAGRNDMKRFYQGLAIAAVMASAGWALSGPAVAAPPTVTPTPGYDARLQEQRNGAAPVVYERGVLATRPVARHHRKHVYNGAR